MRGSMPDFTRPRLAPSHTLAVSGAGGLVRQQQRQQQQIRQDDRRHADACRDGQLTNRRHRDEQDGDKPNRVRDQRHAARHEQLPERTPRRSERVAARKQLGAKRPHHLHAVAHPNRKNEERHEDRHRVNAVTKPVQQAKLPRHRRDRAAQRQRREPKRLRIKPDQQRSQHHRHAEEKHHVERPVADVAHYLGEADDMHADSVRLVRCAQFLQPIGHGEGVEPLAGVGVDVEQVDHHHRAVERVGHEPAHVVRLERVLSHLGQACGRRREVGRHNIPAGEAILDDLGEPDIRREERRDARLIDARHAVHFLRHRFERCKIFRRENVPLPRHQRDHHAVGAAELRLIFRERLDVRVSLRELFLEAGVDLRLRSKPKQHHRGQQENNQ